MAINEDYLDLVAEEAAEVIQAIMKIKRFGLHNSHPEYHNGIPNWQVLAVEIGDLFTVIDRLDIPNQYIVNAGIAKVKKLKTFGPDGSYIRNQTSLQKGEKS